MGLLGMALAAALDEEWNAADIGSVSKPGHSQYDSENDQFKLTGMGAGLLGAADGFHFLSRTLGGDFSISAEIKFESPASVNGVAGLMVRRDASPGSPHFTVVLSSKGELSFRERLKAATATTVPVKIATGAGPWLKIARAGDRLAAYHSKDGQSWQWVAASTWAGSESVPVGLAAVGSGKPVIASFNSVDAGNVGDATAPTAPQAAVFDKTDVGVRLQWAPAADDLAVQGYRIYRDGAAIADVQGENYEDCGLPHGATFRYEVRAQDFYGRLSEASAPVEVTTDSSWLAVPWDHAEIGAVARIGEAILDSTTSVFTIKGAGADIAGKADGGHYVYQPLADDGEIVAQLLDVERTNDWSKLVLMVRESLDAGARFAMLGLNGKGEVFFQTRRDTGASVTGATTRAGSKPAWVRLVRRGSQVTGYWSEDGANWTLLAQDTVALPSHCLVGLAVTSRAATKVAVGRAGSVAVLAGSRADQRIPTTPVGLAVTAFTDAGVQLAWHAAADDTGVLGYEIYRNGQLAGWSGVLSYVDGQLAPQSVQSYSVVAVDLAGKKSAASVPVTVALEASRLPAGWAHTDVGGVSKLGNAVDESGKFIVTGSGADIWNTADAFHFAYVPVLGDCDLQIRVESLTGPDAYAKLGVMLRDSLEADSAYAMAMVTPSYGVAFQRRLAKGAASKFTKGSGAKAPVYLRLTRRADLIRAYESADGTTWSEVGAEWISLQQRAWLGIALTAHRNGQIATATVEIQSLNRLAASDEEAVPAAWAQKIAAASLADSLSSASQIRAEDDFDGDGLSNGLEIKLGLDPTSRRNGEVPGYLTWQRWNIAPVSGNSVQQLLDHVDFPHLPHASGYLPLFETPQKLGDYYGTRIRGYITVPEDGEYRFWVSGDDHVQLFLSLDDKPARRKLVAEMPGYTFWRQWSKYPTQGSAAFNLKKGQKLYTEVLHRNGTGSDHISMGWQRNGGKVEIIEGEVLSSFPDDADGDDLPDTWEQRIIDASSTDGLAGVEHVAGADDYDGDFLTNEDEYTLGTDPVEPQTAEIAGRAAWEVWLRPGNGGLAKLRGEGLGIKADYVEYLSRLETRRQLGDGYVSRIRGEIIAPQTGAYTFWITGDNTAQFYLGKNGSAAFKIAEIPAGAYAGPNEWEKYPSQKSAPVELVAGQRYAFEVFHEEGTGADYVRVGWQRPGSDAREIIEEPHLACAPVSGNARSAEQPLLVREIFSPIPGAALQGLVSNRAFSRRCGEIELLYNLESSQNRGDNYGSRIRGYLQAPQSGPFTFFICSDDEGEFWLSHDESTAGLQKVAWVAGHAPWGNWTKFAEQQSQPVELVEGQWYCFEVLQKEGSGSDHVAVAWQTPGGSRAIIPASALRGWKQDPNDLNGDGLPDAWQMRHFGNLGVGASADSDQDGLVNIEEWRFGSDPTKANSDTDAADDLVEFHLGTDPVSEASPGDLFAASPWTVIPLGTKQVAEGIRTAQGLLLKGSGERIGLYEDKAGFAYQSLPARFEIITRLDFLHKQRGRSQAGLSVRGGPEGGAAMATIVCDRSGNIQFIERVLPGGKSPAVVNQTVAAEAAQWVKIARKGAEVSGYVSENGADWRLVATALVGLGDNALAGPIVCSGSPTGAAVVGFEDLVVWADRNGDGIWDGQEIETPTTNLTGDSDGDGVSDYDEIYTTFTNPNVADLRVEQVAYVAGRTLHTKLGLWKLTVEGITNTSQTGAVEFEVDLPATDMYRLELTARNYKSPLEQMSFDVAVAIDGHGAGNLVFTAGRKKPVTTALLTPRLKAGRHTVTLTLNNLDLFGNILIENLRLVRLIGADRDESSASDWTQVRSEKLNDAAAPLTTLTSPACVEGYAIARSGVKLSPQAVVAPGPDDTWYANVPLDPEKPTAVTVQYDEGLTEDKLLIEWLATNVAETGKLAIRKGDALKLGAWDQGAAGAAFTVSIYASDAALLAEHASANGQPVVYAFDQAGAYKIVGMTATGGRHELALTVVESSFGAPPLFWTGKQQTWRVPGLARQAVVQADKRLSFQEKGPTKPRSFDVITDREEDRIVVARLGEDGPILSHAVVPSVKIASASHSYIRVVDTLPDGTRVVEMSIVLSRPEPHLRIDLDIFVSGVVFDDGTTKRTLTAGDFDANGIAKVRMLMTDESRTSACHHFKVYNNGNLLGSK